MSDWLSRGPFRYGDRKRSDGIVRQEALSKFRGRHGAAKIISLPLLAPEARQQIGCGAVLDAFGDDRQAQHLTQAYRGADNRRIVRVGFQLMHEIPVDLQPVEREFLQIAQAGIAGAEIVEDDSNPEILDPAENLEGLLVVHDQDVFRHLELEQRRGTARAPEDRHERRYEVARLKL